MTPETRFQVICQVLSRRAGRVRRFIVRLTKFLTSPLPLIIGIETQTRCNRRCNYCPNSTQERVFHEMPVKMFLSVCTTLANAGFTGELHLHAYGEPLLDNRLGSLILMAKKILPKSDIHVATNGDFLTPKIESELACAGLSVLIVTRHDDPKSSSTVRFREGMLIEEGPVARVIYNRIGLVNLPDMKWKRLKLCVDVLNLWIAATGDIAFCCHDYAAMQGTKINVADKDWLKRWGSFKNRLLRLSAIIGPRPVACRKCRVGIMLQLPEVKHN